MPRASTFTTYCNTVLDKNTEQQFDRLAAAATRAFTTIQRSASSASAATAGLLGGRGTGGLGAGTSPAVRLQAQAQRAAAVAYQVNARAARDNSAAVERQGRIAEAAARKNSLLSKTLETSATSLRIVQGQLGPVAGRVQAVAGAINELTGLRLGVAGLGAAIFGLARSANQFTEIRTALQPFYETQRDVNAAMADVVGISNRSRQALAPIAQLYTRINQAGKEFGITSARAARITEIAAKAASLSGGSKDSQNDALRQFTQGLGSNQFGGDELRSVKEGAFRLAKAIADGLGVSIAQLKELGANGELTAEKVATALERSADRIETEFGRMDQTLGSSSTKFVNNLLLMAGGIDSTLGLTSTLARSLSFVADNLKGLATIAAGVAAGFAAIKAATFVGEISSGVKQFLVMQAAVTELGKRRSAEALVAKHAAAERVQELEEQRLEIFRVIGALEQQAAEEAKIANLANRNAAAGFPGASVGGKIVGAAEANAKLADTAGKLSQAQAAAARNSRLYETAVSNAAVATDRYEKRVAIASGRTSLFKLGMSGLLSVFNPYALVVGLATTALISYATRTTAAEKAIAGLTAEQRNAIDAIDATTKALLAQDSVLARQEVRSRKKLANDANDAEKEARGNLASSINELANGAGFSTDGGKLRNIANQLRDGILTIKDADAKLEPIRQRNPSLFRAGIVDKILGGAQTKIDDQIKEGMKQAQVLKFSQKNLTDAQDALDQALKHPPAAPTTTPPSTANIAALAAQAEVAAYDDGTHALKEASARRKAAIAALDSEFGVKGGKIDPSKSNDYLARRTEIEKTYKQETDLARAQKAAAAQALSDQRKRGREAIQLVNQQETAEERIARIREKFDEAPRLADQGKQALRELDDLIKKYGELKDAKSRAIVADATSARGVVVDNLDKPYKEYLRAQQEGLAIQRLVLQGRNAEAAALQTIYDLTEQMGPLDDARKKRIYEAAVANEQITRELEAQQRLVNAYTSAVGDAQRTLEDFLGNLRKNPKDAFKNLGKQLQDNLGNLQIRLISEKLFGGLEDELKDLVNGNSGVRSANDFLKDQTERAGDSLSEMADTVVNVTNKLSEVASGTAVPGTPGSPASQVGIGAAAATIGKAVSEAVGDKVDDIVVTGKRGTDPSTAAARELPNAVKAIEKINEGLVKNLQKILGVQLPQVLQGVLAQGLTGYAQAGPVGGVLGALKGIPGVTGKLDKLLGKSDALGGAIGGAQTGAMVAGIGKMLGLKTSTLGGQIGGAAGSFLPIPGGQLIGSIIGSVVGGLFKKTPKASTNLRTRDDDTIDIYGTTGQGKGKAERKAAAKAAAHAIDDALLNLMDQFGTGLADNVKIGAIGSKKKKFFFDAPGAGGKEYFSDQADAITAAITYAVNHGVIEGMKQSVKNLITSGKDLNTQIEKASLLESIPKRLLAFTDPVRAAVEGVNDEFKQIIRVLDEADASASEYADAQKLYEFERAKAIEQATSQASSAIEDFLKDMKGGSNSPLSRRAVYANAQSDFSKIASDVNAGKAVDDNKLLDAATRFQDASRALNGSNQSFFSDFDTIFNLLTKAKANITGSTTTSTGTLPASPFANNSSVNDAIAATSQAQVAATNTQTNTLAGKLDTLAAIMKDVFAGLPNARVGYSKALAMLPGIRL